MQPEDGRAEVDAAQDPVGRDAGDDVDRWCRMDRMTQHKNHTDGNEYWTHFVDHLHVKLILKLITLKPNTVPAP